MIVGIAPERWELVQRRWHETMLQKPVGRMRRQCEQTLNPLPPSQTLDLCQQALPLAPLR